MSFEYDPVDIEQVDSVSLTGGEITPIAGQSDGSCGSTTKAQKKKRQMVDYLEDDFERFHTLLDELIEIEPAPHVRELLAAALGVPNYVNCNNCRQLGEGATGAPICEKTDRKKDGETVYTVISDPDTVPPFCPSDRRSVSFPADRLDEVNDDLMAIIKSGYDEYVEEQRKRHKEKRKEALDNGKDGSWYVKNEPSESVNSKPEYAARQLSKLVGGLFDPVNSAGYRKSAIEVAWMFHLEDVLQDDYHHSRAEAYLRAMESELAMEAQIGQQAHKFERDVRDYFKELGFPMFDRVFELEGASTKRKEMDIHTQLPWGDRAIIEVYTRGAHRDKDKQVSQYAELLKLAEETEATEIRCTDHIGHRQRVNEDLLFKLLDTEIECPPEVEPPSDPPGYDRREDPELVGEAESLSYSEFTPEYEPVEESQNAERRLFKRLQERGYQPTLPVYRIDGYCLDYGFCGPTVKLGDEVNRVSVTLTANRESLWYENGRRNGSMYGNGWAMEQMRMWGDSLKKIRGHPATVLEVTDDNQSLIHPYTIDALLCA